PTRRSSDLVGAGIAVHRVTPQRRGEFEALRDGDHRLEEDGALRQAILGEAGELATFRGDEVAAEVMGARGGSGAHQSGQEATDVAVDHAVGGDGAVEDGVRTR